MDKFMKKKKDVKKETNKDTKVQKEKKKASDDQEQEPVEIKVQLQLPTEEQQPKVAKPPSKKIDEDEIKYEMENPNVGKTEVRISWVPQQGGVVKKFDYEQQKEHFVAIGEQYTPEVKKSNFVPNQNTASTSGDNRPKFTNSSIGGGNMATMEKTAQQIAEEQIEAKLSGLRAPTLSKEELEAKKKREQQSKNSIPIFDNQRKIPMFTKGNPIENNSVVIEKTKQQLLQQQLASKNQSQPIFVSRQQRAAKQAQRKKRQQQASKMINFGSGERKIPTFTSGNSNNFKALEKTPQQLAEQKIQQQLKARNLTSKISTKQQIQQGKLKRMERQQQSQAQKVEDKPTLPSAGQAQRPRFFNSSKKNDQPQFADLK